MFFGYNSEELRWKAELRTYQMARACLLCFGLLSLFSTFSVWITDGAQVPLFSAFLPYHLIMNGMYESGMLSQELYPSAERYFAGHGVFVIGLLSALILVALYFLCWGLSKSRPARGWMILALVLLIADTIDLLWNGNVLSLLGLLEVAIHAFLIYQVALGVRSAFFLSHPPTWTKDLLPPSFV